jgi:proteasome lid subunit RPN8/RPN11
MNMIIRIPAITFAESVSNEIRRTVGSLGAETGGILAGNPDTGQVTHFYFDRSASRSRVTYTVAADRINPVIGSWNKEDIHLMGVVHSHPRGIEQPSPADLELALRILRRTDNAAMDHFLIPIVQTAADGAFSMRVFSVARGLDGAVLELPYVVSPLSPRSPFPVQSPLYERTFARVRKSYDLWRLHRSMVIAVGSGGAASFLEDLARAGVGFFLLIDPDVVNESNLPTQQCYRKDLGRPKVAVVKERILDINPFASVTSIQDSLEALTDDALRTLVFDTACRGEEVEARLLCGLTDSFPAQMRVNLLALNFGLPALAAQVYRAGAAAEIVFTHPDTTRQCMRCILSQRYKAYLQDGFRNNASSDGAQYVATIRLNATKFFVAMSLLHHGTDHSFWASMLARIGQRNCIQIRCDPDLAQSLGLQNFDHAFAGASPDQIFTDETIWRPQHPENRANGYAYDCPDCGGTGDLRDSIGRFGDTGEHVRNANPKPELKRSPCTNS